MVLHKEPVRLPDQGGEFFIPAFQSGDLLFKGADPCFQGLDLFQALCVKCCSPVRGTGDVLSRVLFLPSAFSCRDDLPCFRIQLPDDPAA